MASPDIFYKYKALKGQRSIRLLRIFEGGDNTPLRSKLEEVSLDDQPIYRALSYVWGSPTVKKNLQIDDKIFKIQPTVFDALRRFRRQYGTFSIWIDAICINQTDLDERSAQVAIMRHVYESATAVLVYLGEVKISHVTLFRLLHEFVYQHRFHNFIDRVPKLRASPMVVANQRATSISKAQNPNSVESLPEFWRPRPLLQLLRETEGSRATDPRDCVFALVGISEEAEEAEFSPNYRHSVDDIMKRVGIHMAKKGQVPLLLESASGCDSLDWTSWIPQWHKAKGGTFGKLMALTEFGHFTASGQSVQNFQFQADFSLLGQGILVDEILNLGSDFLVPNSLKKIPTSDDWAFIVFQGLAEALSMMCPRRPYITGEPKSSVLWRLGVCDQQQLLVSQAPVRYHREMAMVIHRMKEELLELYKRNGDPRYKALYQEACTMINMLPELPTLSQQEIRAVSWRLEFLAATAKKFGHLIRYKTGKGYIGQVAEHAKVGDKVALLQGCNKPLVLRPAGDGAYRFVNTCSLHGIMYGEAWDEEKLETIKIV